MAARLIVIMPSMLNLLFLALSRTSALSCATDVSTAGTKTSLGTCSGGSLNSGCRKPNGVNHQPHEWVNGVYFISGTQRHVNDTHGISKVAGLNVNGPLVGQIYICSVTSKGGYGVEEAACCNTNAETPLSATRASQFGPTGGYRTYYDCSACPLPPSPPPPSPPPSPIPPCRGFDRFDALTGSTYDYPEGYLQVDFSGSSLTINNLGGYCGSGDTCSASEPWLLYTNVGKLRKGATAQAQGSSPFPKN